MKWLRIGWAVLFNLVFVAIVLSIFGAADAKFATVTFSLLVLIYVSLVSGNVRTSLTLIEMDKVAAARFVELRALAGQPRTTDEAEALKDNEESAAKVRIRVIIDSIGLTICALFALVKLVGAL